jgi:hypothetical protein
VGCRADLATGRVPGSSGRWADWADSGQFMGKRAQLVESHATLQDSGVMKRGGWTGAVDRAWRQSMATGRAAHSILVGLRDFIYAPCHGLIFLQPRC